MRKINAFIKNISQCRRIIFDELKVTTKPDTLLVQFNSTKLSDGVNLNANLNFLRKVNNFYVSNFSFVFIYGKKCQYYLRHVVRPSVSLLTQENYRKLGILL